MSRAAAQPRRRLLPWLLLGGALVALLSAQLLGQLRPEPLPVIAVVPSFSLVDQGGNNFDDTALRDRVWVASFIYTSCPGPCPRMVGRLAELQKQFAGNPGLRLISFSVDPDRDSPEVLAKYAAVHGVDGSQWKLLAGRTETIAELVRNGFALVLARAGDLPAGDEEARRAVSLHGPIIHSVHLVLVDGEMRVRGYYDSNEPQALDRLSGDIGRLLAGT